MTPEYAYQTVQQTLYVLAPEILLVAVAIVMMTASPFVMAARQRWSAVAAAALAAGIVTLMATRHVDPDVYVAVAVNDAMSFYVRLFVLLSGFILLGIAHREPPEERAAEFFGSFLMIQAGTMLTACSNDLILLFVALELVSIPTYLWLYLSRRTAATQEAVTKYFFLSIFASALLLYGMAFLYGLAGTTNLKALGALASSSIPYFPNLALGVLAVVFVVAGLCFRIAAVPLHFYAPDVYQASPLPVAAMLAWIPKVVGILAMIRALTAVLSARELGDPLINKVVLLCWIVAAATMTLGNVMGLLQHDLKRLLAYSSIAHAGYMMVAITAAFAGGAGGDAFYHGVEAVLYYLAAYAFMTLGTFGLILALKKSDGRPAATIEDLSGVGWTNRIPALGLTICLLGLLGFPPLSGFMGKFQIFASAFSAVNGPDASSLQLLAVIGMLNAAVGAFYYLRIIVLMYFGKSEERLVATGGWPIALATGACAVLTLAIGVAPESISRACREAAVAANFRPDSAAEPVPAVAGTVEAPGASIVRD
jgi:NADH-quinone oxidoreductase subunit N